jgi:purine-binding chemotaxis protein CheW
MSNILPDKQLPPEENDESVDWAAIRAMLDDLGTLLDGGEESPALYEQILQRRADQIAESSVEQQAEQEQLSILEMHLGKERYALPVQNVLTIAELQTLTPIPCVPDFYRGLCNIRGKIYSVLDLEKYFGLVKNEAENPAKQMLIVVNGAGLEIGLIADSVTTVIDIPPNAFVSGQTIGYEASDAVSGVTQDGLVLLDIDALFSAPRIRVDERASR